MDTESKKKTRCTNRQKNALIDYMMTHSLFAKGEFSGPLGCIKNKDEWVKLKTHLDEIGPAKPLIAWQRTWRDLKKKARRENSALRSLQTTGNTTQIIPVGESSQKVLGIIGMASSTGIGPSESGIAVGKHTSNLKNHIAVKHNKAYNKMVALNKNEKEERKDSEETQSQSPSQARSSDVQLNSSQSDVIQNLKMLCMKLVVIHSRPLALISDEAFRKILDTATILSDRTTEINEKSVMELIPEIAHEIKLKIASETRNKLICLKLDYVMCKERKFVGVNIQYIKNNKIIVRNLAVLETFQSQTDEFFKESILEILTEFLVQTEQIYSLTMDNGSNVKRMIKLFEDNCYPDNLVDSHSEDDTEESEEEENEVPEGSVFSDLLVIQNALSNGSQKIRITLCAARSLQLAIKDSLNENVQVQVTFDIARNISRILRNPPNRNLLKMAALKVPIIDNATRWTTRYNMLLRLRSLKDFCENIHDVTCLISTGFWDEVDQLLICLKPFYDCTYTLQNEQLTVGDFYINWMNCKAKISSFNHPLASSLRQSMERREKTLFEADVVLEALFLDGRLNVVLSRDQCERAKNLLNQTRDKLQQLTDTRNADDSSSDVHLIEIKSEPEPNTSADFIALEEMLMQSEIARGLQQQPMSSFNGSLQELQCMSRLPLDTNIIEHWSCQTATVKYSELAKVAHIVLATPVTQVSVDRMFSSLKFMLSPLRSNLGPTFLQQMVFIRANKDLLE